MDSSHWWEIMGFKCTGNVNALTVLTVLLINVEEKVFYDKMLSDWKGLVNQKNI